MNKPSISRSLILDLIRILAISLVAFAHIFQSVGNKTYGGFFGWPGFYYVSWGGVGVTIFIVLSGFLLEIKQQNANLNFKKYIQDKFLRIYPTYWIALAFSLPIYLLNVWYTTGNAFSPAYWAPLDIICSLLGICVFLGRWGGVFMDTAWYIGLIMSLYFVFPVASKYYKSSPILFLLLTLVLSISSRLWFGYLPFIPSRSQDWFLVSRLFEFTFGIHLAANSDHQLLKKILTPKSSTIVIWLSEISFPFFLIHHPLLFIIPHLHKITFQHPFTSSVAIYLCVCLFVSYIILEVTKLFEQALNKKMENTKMLKQV